MSFRQSIESKNRELAALLESPVEQTLAQMQFGPEYLKTRTGSSSDLEFVENWKTYRSFLTELDEATLNEIESIEMQNIKNYFSLLETEIEAQRSLDRAAYFFSGRDYIPAESIDAEWLYVDRKPHNVEAASSMAQDVTETGIKHNSMDLVLIKAPGQETIGIEEIVSEAYRILDEYGVLAASEDYAFEPGEFEYLSSLEPRPAVFTGIFDDSEHPAIRNMEGRLDLYRKQS